MTVTDASLTTLAVLPFDHGRRGGAGQGFAAACGMVLLGGEVQDAI